MLFRLHCPCCNSVSSSWSNVATTPPLPAFLGCVSSNDQAADLLAEQSWVACTICGTVFLRELIEPEILYQGAHATSAGGIWDEHHREFAAFLAEHASTLDGSILEVGGGVGKLAASFRALGQATTWEIMAANPPLEGSLLPGVSYFPGLFGPDTPARGHASIVFSHCLEHVFDLRGVVKNIASA